MTAVRDSCRSGSPKGTAELRGLRACRALDLGRSRRAPQKQTVGHLLPLSGRGDTAQRCGALFAHCRG
jgi:hypothetical protein